MKKNQFSKPLLERVPLYLKYLNSIKQKEKRVSATLISQALNLGEVQVRKDLNLLSGSGKPKIGYEIDQLIVNLEEFLGKSKRVKVALIGAGKLGKALYGYGGFEEYGVEVCAAFDTYLTQTEVFRDDKYLYPLELFSDYVRDNDISIGIIAVPESSAQKTADLMVKSGIKAIWNFAPSKLIVPEDILLRNENMAASLAVLASAFKD
ncbi:MAG: redox-sensing transcriptional repressor Rex [Clostridia bacterium]|nr:redox-sensing transcriptional repressor Rex [Clostridia bacterium]